MRDAAGAERDGVVGVLFVHGIGDQQRAVTLNAYAEPLVRWADARLRAHGGSAEVTDAAMGATGDEPAHEQVALTLPDGARARWLLAEALWADSFPAPPAAAVLRWAGAFSRRAVVRLVSHLLRPIGATIAATSRGAGAARRTLEETSAGAATGYLGGASFLQFAVLAVGAVLLFLFYVWVPLVAYALVLLGVGVLTTAGAWIAATALGVALKIPLLRRRVEPLAVKLVTSVGDTYALLRERGPAASMRGSIRDSLRWVSERSDRVVVVAHSQGAALSVALLARERAPAVDWLVTVGGAVGLLRDVEAAPVAALRGARPQLRWTNVWAGWDPVSAGPVVDEGESAAARWTELYSAEQAMGPARDPQAQPPTLAELAAGAGDRPAAANGANPLEATAAGRLLLGTGRAMSAGVGEAYRQAGLIALQAIPEPGEQPATSAPGPAEVAVHNRASLLLDHNTYAGNDAQVIARIAEIAADVGGHGEQWRATDGAASQAAAERRHVTAVRLLGAARILNGLTAAAVTATLVARGAAGSLRARAEDAVGAVSSTAGTWIERVPEGDVADAGGWLLLALLLFALFHGATAAAWSAWRRAELPRAASGAGAPRRARAAVFGLLVAASGVATIALAAWSVWRDDAHTAGDEQGLLVIAASVLALIGWSWLGRRPRPLVERR